MFPMFGSCDALCVQTAGCPVCADCRPPCVSGPPGYCRMAGLVYVDPRVHWLPARPQPASDSSHNHPQISLRAFNEAWLGCTHTSSSHGAQRYVHATRIRRDRMFGPFSPPQSMTNPVIPQKTLSLSIPLDPVAGFL